MHVFVFDSDIHVDGQGSLPAALAGIKDVFARGITTEYVWVGQA